MQECGLALCVPPAAPAKQCHFKVAAVPPITTLVLTSRIAQ